MSVLQAVPCRTAAGAAAAGGLGAGSSFVSGGHDGLLRYYACGTLCARSTPRTAAPAPAAAQAATAKPQPRSNPSLSADDDDAQTAPDALSMAVPSAHPPPPPASRIPASTLSTTQAVPAPSTPYQLEVVSDELMAVFMFNTQRLPNVPAIQAVFHHRPYIATSTQLNHVPNGRAAGGSSRRKAGGSTRSGRRGDNNAGPTTPGTADRGSNGSGRGAVNSGLDSGRSDDGSAWGGGGNTGGNGAGHGAGNGRGNGNAAGPLVCGFHGGDFVAHCNAHQAEVRAR